MPCSPRFADRAPAEVYATLLDEGVYLCSERTMYRILAENRAVRERRAQRSHPNHPKPEVVARARNEVWSWDITRLLGPEKWALLLPVRDPGHLQPLRHGLDGGRSGRPRAWPGTCSQRRAQAETCPSRGRPRVLTLHSDSEYVRAGSLRWFEAPADASRLAGPVALDGLTRTLTDRDVIPLTRRPSQGRPVEAPASTDIVT